MKAKLIKTELEYQNAIEYLEIIGDNPDFENDQALFDEFELFEGLIESYEKEHYPIKDADPIEVIKLKMNYQGLKQKDLIPYIGSKGTVSEIMNKKRGLSKKMIRNLSKFLNIDQEILNVKYSPVSATYLIDEECEIFQKEEEESHSILFDFDKLKLKSIAAFSQQIKGQGMLFNYCN